MTNHFHLVIETPRANLPNGMRQLNGLYAGRFNRRYDRCGHVFQARYRSILVEKETHLVSACRYVDLNPVRAGLVTDPADYPWSSHRATAGLASAPSFLTTDWVLGHFAPTRRSAQARYRAYVLAGVDEAISEQVRGERLGTVSLLRETFGLEAPLPEFPRVQVEPLPPSLGEIFDRERFPLLVAYRRHGYTIGQIAAHLGKHYSTASRRLRREEAAAHEVAECKT
jgi:putative transposase